MAMAITIKQRLMLPSLLLGGVAVLAIIALLFSYAEMSSTREALTQLNQYRSQAEPLKRAIDQFIQGQLDKSTLQNQVEALRNSPDVGRVIIQRSAIDSALDNIEALDQKLSVNDEITSQILDLSQSSISESNSYMPFIRDKLLKSRNAVTPLEINTIVGANTNTNVNYQIQTLFLQTASSGKTDAQRLLSFVATAIDNIEKDVQALAGTPMQESPQRAKAITLQIQTLTEQFLANRKQIEAINKQLQADISQMVDGILSASAQISDDNIGYFATLLTVLVIGLVIAIAISAAINFAVARSVLRWRAVFCALSRSCQRWQPNWQAVAEI